MQNGGDFTPQRSTAARPAMAASQQRIDAQRHAHPVRVPRHLIEARFASLPFQSSHLP